MCFKCYDITARADSDIGYYEFSIPNSLTITFPSVSTVRSICVLIDQHTFIYNTNVEIIYTRDKSTQSIKTFSTAVYALFVQFMRCVFWFALILRIFVLDVIITYDEVWYWYLILGRYFHRTRWDCWAKWDVRNDVSGWWAPCIAS